MLIPPAFGLAGVNLHTWTGAWGTVTYWNAFVANLEMHGSGTFFDPRLDNRAQFPVAAKAGSGHLHANPDLVTSKLGALQFYQLAIPAPRPARGSFDQAVAQPGSVLFNGKARCSSCHVPPLMTEPGWNLHALNWFVLPPSLLRGQENDWYQGQQGQWHRDGNSWRWESTHGDEWYQGRRGHWYQEQEAGNGTATTAGEQWLATVRRQQPE